MAIVGVFQVEFSPYACEWVGFVGSTPGPEKDVSEIRLQCGLPLSLVSLSFGLFRQSCSPLLGFLGVPQGLGRCVLGGLPLFLGGFPFSGHSTRLGDLTISASNAFRHVEAVRLREHDLQKTVDRDSA